MTISAYQDSLANTSGSTSAFSKLSTNQQTFLTLLTTQLKNQDPTNPTDTKDFTNQLVMYSQVEQQINTNKKLDVITKLQGNSAVQNALGAIGKDVKVDSNILNYSGTGKGAVEYNLSANAKSNTINVLDEKGKIVFSTKGSLESGVHTFEWDGKKTDGTQAAKGKYTVSMEAKDAAGKAMTPDMAVWGQVNSIEANDKEVLVVLDNGYAISYTKISDIREHVPPTK